MYLHKLLHCAISIQSRKITRFIIEGCFTRTYSDSYFPDGDDLCLEISPYLSISSLSPLNHPVH